MGRYISSILIWATNSLAFAYPTPVDFSGELARWQIDVDQPEVTYRVASESVYDEAFLGTLTDDAARIWSEVEGSFIRLRLAEETETEQILVQFKSSIEGQSFAAGFAVFDELDDELRPVHCSISILVEGSLIGLQKTTLHEIGHCLGLGHTLIPQAIMSYNLDQNAYALDTDDRAAVSRLYPADGSPPGLPPGCSTLHRRFISEPFFICLFLFFPFLFIKKGGNQLAATTKSKP